MRFIGPCHGFRCPKAGSHHSAVWDGLIGMRSGKGGGTQSEGGLSTLSLGRHGGLAIASAPTWTTHAHWLSLSLHSIHPLHSRHSTTRSTTPHPLLLTLSRLFSSPASPPSSFSSSLPLSSISSTTMSSKHLLELLDPTNCAVLFIDHQPAMTFGVASIDRQSLITNCVGLAKAAITFKVPVILTAVESKSFSGAIWPQLTSLFPDTPVIERSSMNSWEDKALVAAVKKTGRKKLVIAALWTEVCLCFPALHALAEGFEIYAVEDCSGGTSLIAHDAAISRIVQAGGVRVTWVQVMLEWQRDWARRATYDAVMVRQTHSPTHYSHYLGPCVLSTASPIPSVCVTVLRPTWWRTRVCTDRQWSTATRWCTRPPRTPSASRPHPTTLTSKSDG